MDFDNFFIKIFIKIHHIGSFRAFVECDLDEKSIPDSFATLPTLQRQVKDRKKTRKDQKITIKIFMIMMIPNTPGSSLNVSLH